MTRLPARGDPILEALSRNLLATSAIGREPTEIGAFAAFFAPGSDAYLLSVAVPAQDSADWSAELAALTRAFEQRRRQLRLEFFEEHRPGLAPILDLAGISCDGARAAMVLEARELRVVAGAVPARVLFVNAQDRAAIDAFQAV